jgi:hypothetical protein
VVVVKDTRLMVMEPEFVSPLKVARRDGNTLSSIIRQAWDGGPLRTLTRNHPLEATGAHISVCAHITAEELHRHLNSTEVANGFANRFMWWCVRRSKLLPDGGNLRDEDLAPHIDEVKMALQHARRCGRMERDGAARDLWHAVYPRISEGEVGIVGALLARGEAQILRTSMVIALLNRSAMIREPHLRAALAMWDYSARSVRLLFGDNASDPEVESILRELRGNPTGVTRTQISGLFARHRDTSQIDRALRSLSERGLAHRVVEPTAGRPVERWVLSPNSHSSQSTIWPEPPSPELYDGLLGRIIDTIEPHTEADPFAIAAQILIAFGNAIGRTPFMPVEADRHHTNLFGVLVGDTSKARKGTSWGHARRIVASADPDWEARVKGGLSSGEGLIAQVADREESE